MFQGLKEKSVYQSISETDLTSTQNEFKTLKFRALIWMLLVLGAFPRACGIGPALCKHS